MELTTGVGRSPRHSSALNLYSGISFIPLPKSDTPARIEANADVFNFELTEEQMAALDGLDRDEHVCLNPTGCP